MELVYEAAYKNSPTEMVTEHETMNNKVHTFFSRSSKRTALLKEFLQSVGAKMFKIGQIFDVR